MILVVNPPEGGTGLYTADMLTHLTENHLDIIIFIKLWG